MYCYGCYRLVAWIFKDINCACSLIMRKKLLVKNFFAAFAIYQTDANVHLIKRPQKTPGITITEHISWNNALVVISRDFATTDDAKKDR